VLTTEQVKEILSLNAKKKKVEALEDFVIDLPKEEPKNFQNAVGQDDLNRFDKPKKKRKNKKRRNPNSQNTSTPQNNPIKEKGTGTGNKPRPSSKNRNNGNKKRS